ncbi:MAG TPA: GntR family transcriptional regulator [Frankiaceae bacterium]|jgi:GntR family transcriptional regulator|nr:GntR family transcriptional regulator [Frankiaceae bacterium]
MSQAVPELMRTRRDHDARRLRDLLRSEVLAGRYTDGLLPSEAALMIEYGASRATVRSALNQLRLGGQVERIQGTGTFVVAERYALRLVEFHGVERAISPDAMLTADVLDNRVVPMPAPVAAQLEETTGAPCLRLEYRGLSHGRVIALCTNYLRFPEAAAVMNLPFDSHWYDLMTAAGLDVAGTDLLIEAVLADDSDLAGLLEVEVNAPLLAAQQVIRDGNGRPFDFAILRLRADRIALLARGVAQKDQSEAS